MTDGKAGLYNDAGSGVIVTGDMIERPLGIRWFGFSFECLSVSVHCNVNTMEFRRGTSTGRARPARPNMHQTAANSNGDCRRFLRYAGEWKCSWLFSPSATVDILMRINLIIFWQHGAVPEAELRVIECLVWSIGSNFVQPFSTEQDGRRK